MFYECVERRNLVLTALSKSHRVTMGPAATTRTRALQVYGQGSSQLTTIEASTQHERL
jgi:hypothetical protein